ncbi:uncharacterized protein PGTG_14206 [Puccinia graminis f. sp. tritici CRL 75-36-700-3]|uniref:Uncharacterized protein n=1 Tax=Puccinia graminis f. sp. tritici (strain CRL 75-36-700-3 / race SCCL) TaxID=418459 RepID=E3KWX4_PUCGT|nr:uncharacterized protein PGTG_14206 [Puccinia graminis f. sp. tritici CRL 75-36-700-3]EFP88867.1 hypothetical protein PGTG_14206 [Puccinia graminis f. sp. tritici CRL 75-36-700-3]
MRELGLNAWKTVAVHGQIQDEEAQKSEAQKKKNFGIPGARDRKLYGNCCRLQDEECTRFGSRTNSKFKVRDIFPTNLKQHILPIQDQLYKKSIKFCGIEVRNQQ